MKLIVAKNTEEMAKLSAKQAADVLNAAIEKKRLGKITLVNGRVPTRILQRVRKTESRMA